MTMNYTPPPAGPVPVPPMPPPPGRGPRNKLSVVVISSAVAAAAALVLSVIAVTRAAPAEHPKGSSTTQVAPNDGDRTAAQKAACESWDAAAKAMVVARQPFLDATTAAGSSWDDPGLQGTLAQAQAGTLTQVEFLRTQLTERTPPEVAEPIREYIELNIGIIALDGQHQPAAIVNAKVRESNAVRDRIESICGKS